MMNFVGLFSPFSNYCSTSPGNLAFLNLFAQWIIPTPESFREQNSLPPNTPLTAQQESHIAHESAQLLDIREAQYARSALHFAVAGGYDEAMQILVAAGCSLDVTDHEGATPLHYACRYGYSACVKTLLDNGADWGICRPGMCPTVLHEACAMGQMDAVACLVGRWRRWRVSWYGRGGVFGRICRVRWAKWTRSGVFGRIHDLLVMGQ